jgi:type I restriction enzyme, S subunit
MVWEVRKLGDVCEVLDNKRKPITKRDRIEGEYPYYGATGILSYVDEYIFDEKLVLIGEDGAKWESGDNTSFIVEGKYWVNNHAHVIRPNRKIVLDEWIVNYLNFSDLRVYVTGLTVPKLNQEKMRSIEIPIPPLAEQKRIVAILDEAFSAISTAKENAEKNLKNSKELFESYLNSLNYKKQNLEFLIDIKTGKLDSNAAEQDGKYPFFTCSRETYAINKYAFDCEAILLAGNNAVGDFNVKHYSGKFNAYQRTYVITIQNENNLLYRYLYYQLLKSLKEFKELSVGAGTKFLKIGMIKNIQIALPPIKEQQRIVAKLDALSEQTKKLEAVYTKKIADLDELKKSILQKAFRGEL